MPAPCDAVSASGGDSIRGLGAVNGLPNCLEKSEKASWMR